MRPIKLFRPHPSISRARDEDLGGLVELYGGCREECAAHVPPWLLDERFPDVATLKGWLRGGFELYKAEMQGVLAGAMRCTFPSGVCLLDGVAVARDWRGQGIARSLLERGISRARRAGLSKVWVQRLPEPPTSLYEALGFKESTRLGAGRREGGLVLLELLL